MAVAALAATAYILPQFDVVAGMRAIEEERLTKLPLVATMLDMMINHPQVEDFDLTSISRITYGASPIHEREFYTTDFLTDVALDYVDRALTEPSRPFLLHVCYNVPHFPLEAPDDLIEKYRGRYLAGWDRLRAEKLTRMKRLGIVPETQKLPEVKGFVNQKIAGFTQVGVETEALPRWESIGVEDRRELDFRRAMYAAQIDRFDQNVGRIVAHLRQRGILDNTLILFFSDNGCSGELEQFRHELGETHHRPTTRTMAQGGRLERLARGQCWASLFQYAAAQIQEIRARRRHRLAVYRPLAGRNTTTGTRRTAADVPFGRCHAHAVRCGCRGVPGQVAGPNHHTGSGNEHAAHDGGRRCRRRISHPLLAA